MKLRGHEHPWYPARAQDDFAGRIRSNFIHWSSVHTALERRCIHKSIVAPELLKPSHSDMNAPELRHSLIRGRSSSWRRAFTLALAATQMFVVRMFVTMFAFKDGR